MRDIQKWLAVMVGAIVFLFAVLIALAVYVVVQQQRTHDALCNFHTDLRQRVEQGQSYLDRHPGPEPFPGISRAQFQQSLTNQRRTIESLSDLHC